MMQPNGHGRRLKALIWKEGLQIVRDPSSILISILLPVLLLFLYGYGVSLDLDHVRVGLLLEDTSPDARSFAQALTDDPYFEVHPATRREQLVDALERGQIRGFVVVPSYFSQYRQRPDQIAPIQVIADGSEPNTAVFVQNYVAGAFQSYLEQEAISQNWKPPSPVRVQPRFWYNEQLESRFFLLSGALAIIMTLIGALLTSLVVAREWERGTMEGLIATPITKSELILSKLIPYFLLGMVSMALCVALSVWGYGLPLRGSIWLLALVTACFLFAALGFGLMVSTLAKNQFVASQIAIVGAFLPAYMLSGFIFEISSMPFYIQWLTYLMPARYFVQCLQTLFMVGNVWSLVLWNLLPMLLVGLIFLTLAVRKTGKRLDL
jgi:ABC-2 type transport system permease protein